MNKCYYCGKYTEPDKQIKMGENYYCDQQCYDGYLKFLYDVDEVDID